MILLDTNVILDVVQKRQRHLSASAAVLEKVIHGQERALLAAHTLTTIHYIVARYRNSKIAAGTVDWLLRYFAIASIGREEILRARVFGWEDFEDAIVAAAAESTHCDVIVTRNVKDFKKSPVPAVIPEEYLFDAPS